MNLFWHLIGSLHNFLNKILLILILPAKFASSLDAAKDTGPPFREAARFYLSTLSISTAILIYLLYFLGGQTIANAFMGTHPDGEKALYVGAALVSTITPAIVLYFALKGAHRSALSLPLFLQILFYAAGAIVVVLAITAATAAAYTLWHPISPGEAIANKMTLLEAAGYPALCDEVRSIECQVSLRFGPDLYFYLSLFLFAVLLYQAIIITVMINKILSGGPRYPVLITAVILAGLVSCLTFGMEWLGQAGIWRHMGTRVQQIVTYNRCAAFLQRGDADKAKPYCTTAAKLRPRYEATHTHLCVVLGQLLDYENALKSCDAAVSAKKDAVTLLVRGATYSSMRRFDKAIEDFTASEAASGRGGLVNFLRGDAYRELRKYKDAVADFDMALNNGISNAKLFVARAKSHIMLNQEALAVADLDKAANMDPRNAEVHIVRGRILKNKDHFKEALAELDRAVALDRRNPVAYQVRCDIFNDREHKDILKDCNEAIRLQPGVASNYSYRARVHARMDRMELAAANYRAGLYLLRMQHLEDSQESSYKFDSLNAAKSLGNLAFTGVLAGEYAQARADAEKGLELAPDQIWIEMNKGHAMAFEKPEYESDAKAMYRKRKGEFWGGRPWKHILADDFRWLRLAVRAPDDRMEKFFDDVEEELGMNSTKYPVQF